MNAAREHKLAPTAIIVFCCVWATTTYANRTACRSEWLEENAPYHNYQTPPWQEHNLHVNLTTDVPRNQSGWQHCPLYSQQKIQCNTEMKSTPPEATESDQDAAMNEKSSSKTHSVLSLRSSSALSNDASPLTTDCLSLQKNHMATRSNAKKRHENTSHQ